MIKLVCCDMDGTLIDTDMTVFLSYKKALEGYDTPVPFTYDYYVKECKGKSYKNFLPALLSKVEDVEDVHEKKKNCYKNCVQNAVLNSSLVQTLDLFKSQGANISLVTTATLKNCIDALSAFNLQNFFDNIITQEDVKRVKPNPEGYIKAMEFFNAKPEETLIFEDSDVGIEAATKTGANVFVVKQFN